MAVRTASVTGVWSNTATWGGSAAPVDGDSVVINTGVVVTLDGTYTAGDDTATAFDVRGTLKASRSANCSLTCKGKLLINTTGGGGLDFGTEADPITSSYTSTLILNYSASMANGKYGLECPYDSANAKNWVSFCGASKTRVTTSTAGGTASTDSITVTDATGWAINDTIVVPSTGLYTTWSQYEVRTISNIAGNVITVSSNFTYTHAVGVRVYNATSNVQIQAYGSTYGATFFVAHAYSSGTQTSPKRLVLKNMTFDRAMSAVGYNGAAFYCYAGANASTTIDNVVFLGDGTANRSYGLCPFGVGVANPPVAISNCYFLRCTNGGGSTCAGLVTWQGCNLTVSNCHFVGCDIALSSGYGPGGNAIFNTCYWRSNSRGFQGNAIYYEFNDCEWDCHSQDLLPTTGQKMVLNRCKFDKSTVGTPSSGDVYYCGSNPTWPTIFNDCQFGTYSNLVSYPTYPYGAHYAAFSNYNLDPSVQYYYTAGGTWQRDNSTYRTAAPALKCATLSSTVSTSATWQVYAPDDKAVAVTGWVRKNSAYGSSNLPTVTLSGLGITPVTWTMTDVNDTWTQFIVSATNTSGTDGMLTLTFTVQSGGASSYVWIDDISAPTPVALSSGEMGYWADAFPVRALSANYVAPIDLWNIQTSDLVTTGSIGKALKTGLGFIKAILGLSA